MTATTIAYASRGLAMLLIDSLAGFAGSRALSAERAKVLVVRLDGIGDFTLWLDAVQSLPKLFPPATYSLTLVANSAWAPLATRLALFDEVIPLDREAFVTDFKYRYSFLRTLRQRGFIIALQPTYSRELFLGDSVVRLSGAKVRIGLDGDRINTGSLGKRLGDRWYTRLIQTGGPTEMELVRNASVVRQLGDQTFRADIPKFPPLSLETEPVTSPYFVVHPGAGIAAKRWPAERFAAIVNLMHNLIPSLHGIICGGADDWAIGEEIRRASKAPLVNSCGATSISQMAGIIAGASLMIGNDTGAVHVAVATGTPAVCILGSGEYGRFFPYRTETGNTASLLRCVGDVSDCAGCGWYCRYADHTSEPSPCICRIGVEEVWTNVLSLLMKVTDSSQVHNEFT